MHRAVQPNKVAGVHFGKAHAPYLTLFGVFGAAEERPLLGRVGSVWERARPRQVSQGEKMYFWLGRCGWEQRPALLCENLAGDVGSWCFPTGHLPENPSVPSRELLIAQQ